MRTVRNMMKRLVGLVSENYATPTSAVSERKGDTPKHLHGPPTELMAARLRCNATGLWYDVQATRPYDREATLLQINYCPGCGESLDTVKRDAHR